MRFRALAVAVPLIVLLAGCVPAGPSPEPSPSYTPTQDQLDAEASTLELPPDALLAVAATATAGNGAELDVTMIVHRSAAASDAADAVATTAAWCAGEVDAQLLSDSGYSFTTIDVTATSGTTAWPADTPVWLQPQPGDFVTLASTGDLVQASIASTAGATPHCATPVRLTGPGGGTIVLGILGDVDGDENTPPLGGWMHNLFGVNSAQAGTTASDVTFSDCVAKVSEIASDQGAGTFSDWAAHFNDPRYCNIGGALGEG
jgi:hypothetical protein